MDIREIISIYESQKEKLNKLENNLNQLRAVKYIDADPLVCAPSIWGKIKYLYKKVVRKSVFWFMKPYWMKQNRYNACIIDTLSDILHTNEAIIADLNRIVASYPALSIEEQKEIGDWFIRYERMNSEQLKVIQIVSTLNYGDAVGNDVVAIQRALQEAGYATAIYAANLHPKISATTAYLISELPELSEKDIVIYHFASEDPLVEVIKKLPCKKVLRYHNVTPPEFFSPYNLNAASNTANGLKQVAEIRNYIDYGMVVSEFNKSDLVAMGYTCDIDVVPILIPFGDYDQKPDQSIIDQYNDDWTNVVFVGRIAPNKKFEDVIASFAVYKEQFNNKSRLLLVGNYDEEDSYYRMLTEIIQEKHVEDVFFTGHISFNAILAYYHIAHVFLCLSEHEGFCVPLVEAMYFKKPIIAYRTTAIPTTLGEGGILIDSKEPEFVAEKIDELMKSEIMQEKCVLCGQKQLEKFQYEKIKIQIIECIEKYREY